MDLPPTHERRTAILRRNRLSSRVTVLGNLLALAATTATGVITGVLASQAQAADLKKAQAAADAVAAARRAAPAPVKLVPKPVRVVKVTVRGTARRPAPTRRSTSVRTSTRSAPTRTTTRTTTATAPTTTTKPASTKTSGS